MTSMQLEPEPETTRIAVAIFLQEVGMILEGVPVCPLFLRKSVMQEEYPSESKRTL